MAAQTIGLGMIAALLARLQHDYRVCRLGAWCDHGSQLRRCVRRLCVPVEVCRHGLCNVSMLVLGGLAAAGSLVWMAFASTVNEFLLARLLLGLSQSVFVPAARRVVLDWYPERPGQELGTILAASAVGFVVGPVLAGLLVDPIGLAGTFIVPAVITLVAVPFVARIEPVPVAPITRDPGFVALLRNRLVVAAVLIGVSVFFAIGLLEAVWARYLDDLGATTRFIGISFGLIVVPLVVLAPLGGRLSDRRGPFTIGVVTAAAGVPVIFLYGQVGTALAVVAVGAVHSLLIAVTNPAAASGVARASPPELVARGQGFLEAMGFLLAALAVALAGVLYGAVGPE